CHPERSEGSPDYKTYSPEVFLIRAEEATARMLRMTPFLFDPLVFSYRKLRVDLTHGFERNGNHDKQRGAGNGKDSDARDLLHDDRKDRDKAEETGAPERNTVHQVAEELGRALARTDAGHEAA